MLPEPDLAPLGPWRLRQEYPQEGWDWGWRACTTAGGGAGDFFGLGTGAGGALVTETAGWGAATCGGLADCDWSLATCERSITTSF